MMFGKLNILAIFIFLFFNVGTEGSYVYVEDFGAVGDAKTYNSNAFVDCFNYAVKYNKTIKFRGGTYLLEKTVNINIPEHKNLIIEGNGSSINMIPFNNDKTDFHYFAFSCDSGSESIDNSVFISNLNFKAPVFSPVWNETNYEKLKIVKALCFFDIFKVTLSRCNFNDIFGYGAISYGVVNMIYENVNFTNVGGHFPLENDYDRYGDAIYFSIYDLENRGKNRKNCNLKVIGCSIKGYDTEKNGNYASRIGICLEGYKAASVDGQKVDVLIKNSEIKYYDRSIHKETLNADFVIEKCLISNYQSYFVNVYSKGSVIFRNCTISKKLKNNPKQERFGNGSIKSFNKNGYNVKINKYNTKITQ